VTVLIVDDDPVSRRLVRMTLERRGQQVAEVASAEAAIEWLKAGASCTLVITDLDLPGRMEGLQFFGLLAASPQWRDLPVIVCTERADEETVNNAIRRGVRHYLLKPVRPAMLMEKVEAILARAVPVLEPRFDAMARLEVSEAENRYLVEDCLARLSELTGQLAEAQGRDDLVESLRVARRFRQPAALLGAERLVRAVDAVAAEDITPKQREQAFLLLSQEVQVLSDALGELSRPGKSGSRAA
jgi:CheY-like chemotaxis protein/HPt (histidine-containing phosphotransfer) domain-containing protein